MGQEVLCLVLPASFFFVGFMFQEIGVRSQGVEMLVVVVDVRCSTRGPSRFASLIRVCDAFILLISCSTWGMVKGSVPPCSKVMERLRLFALSVLEFW